MKLNNKKKIAITTAMLTMMTTVVNATATNDVIARGLGEWVTIVAEILTFLCLIIFAIYMGRFFEVKTDKDEEKVAHGVRNGMMTALIGVAICQAAIIVARICF